MSEIKLSHNIFEYFPTIQAKNPTQQPISSDIISEGLLSVQGIPTSRSKGKVRNLNQLIE